MNSRLILGGLAVIVLGSGLIYSWSTKQTSKKLESPADRYVGVKPRGRATFRFTDLVGEFGSHLVQVDYVLFQVERPKPAKAEIDKPGIAADPIFDKIKATLSNAPVADAVGWKSTYSNIDEEALGVSVKVIDGGSKSYIHRKAYEAQMLTVKSIAYSNDPLELRLDKTYLLMPGKDNRIIGFDRGETTTKFSPVSEQKWRQVDVENNHVEVLKLYESQTSYNVAVFRLGISPLKNVMPISGGQNYPIKPLASMERDRTALADSIRSSYERAKKVDPTQNDLPKLE